jgi:transposase
MLEVREMAYSKDLGEKVLDYRANHSLRETQKTFNISITTILNWEKLRSESGNLDKRPLDRTFKKIDPVKLAEFVIEHPDAYLAEIGENFGCSAPAVFYALENMSITLKKLKFVIVKQMKKNGFYSKNN